MASWSENRDPGDEDAAVLRADAAEARWTVSVSPEAEERRLERLAVLEEQLRRHENGTWSA